MQQRLSLAEPATVAHQRAGSERRVELVARERQEVDARATHVDATLVGQLRRVHEELRPMSVGKVGELGDRPHLPADVRGAGDGDQVDPRPRGAERALTRIQQLVCRAGEPEQPEIVAAPGKHVGVMLDRAREHASARGQRGRQDVDGFGGVADEDDRVVVAGADELADGAARVLERGGRDAGLQPAATVHAAVPGHEPLDGIPHGGHHRSTGRVVEVHVAARATVGTRHNRVGADQLARAPGSGPGGSVARRAQRSVSRALPPR